MDRAGLQCIIIEKVHTSLKEALIRFVGQIFIVEAKKEQKNTLVNVKIERLLRDYPIVFEEPTSLPPAMKFDHRIPLKLAA